jgi:hypothetical protein
MRIYYIIITFFLLLISSKIQSQVILEGHSKPKELVYKYFKADYVSNSFVEENYADVDSLYDLLVPNEQASSPSICNVFFLHKQEGLEINYSLPISLYNRYYNVKLYCSRDGGQTYFGQLKEVSGDVGNDIHRKSGNSIFWDILAEQPNIVGELSFMIKAERTIKEVKRRPYIGYKGSTSAPLGIIAGKTGMPGYYISCRLSSAIFKKYNYDLEKGIIPEYNKDSYYMFNGNKAIKRLSITSGISIQSGKFFHLYIGAGYSYYQVLWEIDEYNYSNIRSNNTLVKDIANNFNSIEVEGGIKVILGSAFVQVGIASPGFYFVEPSISLGLLFN